MWHHAATVIPSPRGIAARAARRAGAALDRRFDAMELRLSLRLERLEERIGVDVEAVADLNLAMRRTLLRLETRLAELETILAAHDTRRG